VQDNPRILLTGRHLIAAITMILENLLVIEDGIYTLIIIVVVSGIARLIRVQRLFMSSRKLSPGPVPMWNLKSTIDF
jgi:hypothetical protein